MSIITDGMGENAMLITEGYGQKTLLQKILGEIIKLTTKITLFKSLRTKV